MSLHKYSTGLSRCPGLGNEQEAFGGLKLGQNFEQLELFNEEPCCRKFQSLGNFKQREVTSTEHAIEWDFIQV